MRWRENLRLNEVRGTIRLSLMTWMEPWVKVHDVLIALVPVLHTVAHNWAYVIYYLDPTLWAVGSVMEKFPQWAKHIYCGIPTKQTTFFLEKIGYYSAAQIVGMQRVPEHVRNLRVWLDFCFSEFSYYSKHLWISKPIYGADHTHRDWPSCLYGSPYIMSPFLQTKQECDLNKL